MNRRLHLFEGFGVELEYMIVDADSLDIRPLADRVIAPSGTVRKNEVTHGAFRWSNELALHVIEIKTNGPVQGFAGLAGQLADEVKAIEQLLRPLGCRLLPTAMHPWMDPHTESRLWPHGDREIYNAFDAIFDCRGHGWTNLQSVHLNLPFEGDDEFRRLHSAIRLVLPLIPAVAASSPIADGHPTGLLDSRLEHYRLNCARIPSITGHIVPELVRSAAEYQSLILDPIYADLVPFDRAGILQEEWTNARGAIARFERNTIEIRVTDIQEFPAADIALLAFVVEILRSLVAEEWSDLATQESASTELLATQFRETMREAEAANPLLPGFARALGLEASHGTSIATALRELFGRTRSRLPAELAAVLSRMLDSGSLARRILRASGTAPDRHRLHEVYRELADCLRENRPFSS